MNEGQRLLYVARVMVGSCAETRSHSRGLDIPPGLSLGLSLPICPVTFIARTHPFLTLPFLSFSIHLDLGRGRERRVPCQPSGTSRPTPPVPQVMPLGMFLKSGSSAGEEGAEWVPAAAGLSR